MAREAIQLIHERAASLEYLQFSDASKIQNDWPDVVAAIHREVITIKDEFNQDDDYAGPQLTHGGDHGDVIRLRCTGKQWLTWDLRPNRASTDLTVTCTLAKKRRPSITVGAVRYNRNSRLVVHTIINGKPARVDDLAEFLEQSLEEFLEIAAIG
jgi:hypothetical protein